jgi:hypothetical protein
MTTRKSGAVQTLAPALSLSTLGFRRIGALMGGYKSMITVGYLIIAAAAFACLVWCLRAYLEDRSTILLLTLIPLLFLWFDSFAIAVGQWIGDGPVLMTFSYLRYGMHWGALPLLFIVAGMLLRRAGFQFAENKFVMGAFCVVAVFFIIEDFRYIFIVDFYPACFGETLRYVTSISAGQECSPEMAGVGSPETPSPAAAILVNISLMLVGIAIWVRHKWPWLFLGCFVMLLAAGTPQSVAGPILGNAGEPIFNFAVVAAVIKFSRGNYRNREPEPAAA